VNIIFYQSKIEKILDLVIVGQRKSFIAQSIRALETNSIKSLLSYY